MSHRFSIVLLSLAMAGLAGCSNDPGPVIDSATQAPTAAPQAAENLPLAIQSFSVSSSKDSTVPAPITSKNPIHVLIDSKGGAAGNTLEINVIDLSSGKSVANKTLTLTTAEPTKHAIVFESPTPWTAGRHLLQISADGKSLTESSIDIVE